MTTKKHKPSKRKRHICVKLMTWASASALFTVAISYLTKGYWEPMANLHFIEFATCAMTLLEDA